MTDPRRSAQQDRRIQEQIEVLFGGRGNALDRALRLRDLVDVQSPAIAPLISLVERRAAEVVSGETRRNDGDLRRAIAAGQQAASDAADLAAEAETQIQEVSAQLDRAVEDARGQFTRIISNLSQNNRVLEDFSTTSLTALAEGMTQRAAIRTSLKQVSAAIDEQRITTATEIEAIAAILTTLVAAINDPEGAGLATLAYLSSNYLTAADTTSAIAGAELNLRAAIDRASPPSDFGDGATHWTGSLTGDPSAGAAPSANWTYAARAANITISGSGDTAMIATRGVLPVSDGDRIRVTVRAKITGSGSGNNALKCQIVWLDGAYATAGITQTVQSSNVTINGQYATHVFELTAPPDAFWTRAAVRFNGANVTSGGVGSLDVVRIENVSAVAALAASIVIGYYTKAQADSAIAAGIETYDASVVGGVSANVTLHKTALATLNGSAARFSALVSAGGDLNVAGLEALAWDEGGVTGTAVRLLGDQVIVPGSLTAGSLVVTDGSGELLANWNFSSGDMRGWTQSSGTTATVVAKSAGGAGLSTANAQYVLRLPAGDSQRFIEGSRTACSAGDRFSRSFEVACGGSSTGAEAILRVRFYDANDTLIQTMNLTATLSGSTWVTASSNITAPANSVYFRTHLNLTPPAGSPIYVANVSIIKRRSGATLITPNSITTDELNVTSLSSITATIGLLRTATTGQRVEIADNVIRVYDSSNVLRVRMGNLA